MNPSVQIRLSAKAIPVLALSACSDDAGDAQTRYEMVKLTGTIGEVCEAGARWSTRICVEVMSSSIGFGTPSSRWTANVSIWKARTRRQAPILSLMQRATNSRRP